MTTVLANVTCVAARGRGLLVQGPSGSGKSSLALMLIDRGAVLVGDDGVTLEPRGGRLWASPPPNTPGLLEVRNVGLVELPTASAPLSLVVRLDEQAPRHLERADPIELAGMPLPLVLLHPAAGGVLPLRAELALARHGLA